MNSTAKLRRVSGGQLPRVRSVGLGTKLYPTNTEHLIAHGESCRSSLHFLFMKHTLFKVVEGKQDDWKSWCEYLCNHRLEAEETLREENCVYERSIMYERDGFYYVVGTADFDGDPRKSNLNVRLNVQHQNARRDCLSKAIAMFEGEFILPPNHEMLYKFDLR